MGNKKQKLKTKVVKDSEKEFVRKNKEGFSVVYPRYRAKANFDNIKFEFSDFNSHSRTSTKFDEKTKLPKNRNEYGMDFVSSDGKLILLRYKLNNKGVPIVNEVEVLS